MKTLLNFLILFSAVVCSAQVFDVTTIAGKTIKQVTELLGPPTREEKTKYGRNLIFKDEFIDIVFVDGKAEWITIVPQSTVPFKEESLQQFGLKLSKPTFKGKAVIRWESAAPLYSVAMFPAGDQLAKIDYVYVQVTKDVPVHP